MNRTDIIALYCLFPNAYQPNHVKSHFMATHRQYRLVERIRQKVLLGAVRLKMHIAACNLACHVVVLRAGRRGRPQHEQQQRRGGGPEWGWGHLGRAWRGLGRARDAAVRGWRALQTGSSQPAPSNAAPLRRPPPAVARVATQRRICDNGFGIG